MHALKPLLLAVSLSFVALPCLAQDHSAHTSSAPHASASSSGQSLGGRFTPNGSQSKPSANVQHQRSHNRYRYGYGYGAPYLLPYDSEYDQLDGRGMLDQTQSEDTSDRRPAPTIFEHNGVAQSLRESTAPSKQQASEASPSGDANFAAAETVLIFRDGHQQEIANYAITGTKLIILGDKTEKIALTDLDLSATTKANADRGVEFKAPAQS